MKFCYVLFITLLVISGIGAAENPRSDAYYSAGINAFEEKNYDQAIDLLDQAIEAYDREGNRDAARDAFLLKKRASWILLEMIFNRTQAEEILTESLPDLSPSEQEKALEPGGSIQMTSDGTVRYFYGIANNVAYHNTSM
ncbi:MAG: tetratricopeptide repeat protein, partial [Methanospirillum sp.]|nr:tetratricopeptide repeat protein [Methanospirillum sp.]